MKAIVIVSAHLLGLTIALLVSWYIYKKKLQIPFLMLREFMVQERIDELNKTLSYWQKNGDAFYWTSPEFITVRDKQSEAYNKLGKIRELLEKLREQRARKKRTVTLV